MSDRHDCRERFTLAFEAQQDAVPVEVRVRKLLKIAGRTLRLKCIKVTWPAEEGKAADVPQQTQEQ